MMRPRLLVPAVLLGAAVSVPSAALTPCSGTAKQALKCDAAQTKKAVCQPCEGTKLKGCSRKVAGPFGQAQHAADAALADQKKGKTSKVETDLGKAQQALDKTKTALHALIDKNHGTQSCKDSVDALITDLGVEIVEEVTGAPASSTTSSSTSSTSSTSSSTTVARACATVHVEFFECSSMLGPIVVDSFPAGIECPSNCTMDFGPSVGMVQFEPEVVSEPINFGGDCTDDGMGRGTLDLSKATSPGCDLSCDCSVPTGP